jgi:small subunit ribosomal protein S20
MANIKSQIKRNQTNELARERNQIEKAAAHSAARKVEEAVLAGKKEEALKVLPSAEKQIDQLKAQGILAGNTASRRKSHLRRLVNGIKEAPAAKK